ncbi:MAG: energy transducer TonB [Xanthomonadales bacterium]|nr:MotA/TolQ/ExbB proton channel family protein [Gammaproteobacteria bacterium]NNE04640.1 energy transducer TonB [Xanthomonadales bacterium]NNL95724.1 energy transducer TonB [Xanthomonadales bacterium]
MKNFNKTIIAALAATLTFGATAFAAETVDLDQLLEQVSQGRVKDAEEAQARLAAFRQDRANQQRLLQEARNEQARQEQLSDQLEQTFEVNDEEIIELERALQERLGDLKELFGVLQQGAGDAIGQFSTSVTQVQFGDRSQFLTEFAAKMGQSNRMASLEEIERLWFELQREMVESGKVVKFTAPVVNANGEEEAAEVTRIGVFNATANGKYLEYVPETGRLVELQRQPQSRYTNRIEDLEAASSGLHAVGLDPTRGQLLGLLVESPSLGERIAQGKEVGYVIIALGIIGVAIALWRLLALSAIGSKVNAQIKKPDQPGDNPLGRVFKVHADNPTADVESLELKLGESILRETPALNRMLPLLKIISVVAPLLGLLGTVTGMIVTFQAITLYGAGDPKLMAGGISQALVTTVLGLVVAIPTVFLHTLVASRARRLTQILQEEAAGILAERAEGQ